MENKSKIVLGGCFALMFLVGFGTGDYVKYKTPAPSLIQTNYTTKTAPAPFLGATSPAKSKIEANATSSNPLTVPTTTPTFSETPIDLSNCLIKGNVSSKIYHVPGQQTYKRFTHPTRCFNTEAEAQAVGFVKAKR